jgi:hypothetical protein
MHRFKAFLLHPKSNKAPGKPQTQARQDASLTPASNPRAPPSPKSVAIQPSQNSSVAIPQPVLQTLGPSAPRSPNLALERAIERHILELSDSDRIAFTKASSEDIGELLAKVRDLDQKHSKQSSFRPYTTRITNFLNIFQLSVGGVAVFLQAESVASTALGGAKLIIGLAIRYVEYFDKLSKMLDDLAKLLAPLSKYAEKCHLPNICDALADVYDDLLKFYSASRKLFVDEIGNTRKFTSGSVFLRSQWEPFDVKFGEIKASVQFNCSVLLQSGMSELLVSSGKSPSCQKHEQDKLNPC